MIPCCRARTRDPDGGDIAIVSVHNLLEEEMRDEAENLPKLPTQRRCAAHTLKPAGNNRRLQSGGMELWTGRQPFTKAAFNAQGLGACTIGPLWWPTRSRMWWAES
ncbi:Hypothetical protein FKW44_018480 [Caligus rogercresseyi]|uniref:Uncharacterized protein n=1 Tax=Caligus rogercresseyi TaxID=217165 RepID=A0A7T8GUZ9_CALRO|nr:Hypothetical protein FKW44_018480 [Caligus rogercresseyi]